MLGRIVGLIIGYAFGNILPGYIIGKLKHVDLTKEGSGNIGSTNTLRTLGVKAGFTTLALDILKCVLAVVITWLIFKNSADNVYICMLYAAVGAIIGHDFPIALKFKGGKGIAATLGFAIAIYPQTVPVCAIVFIATVAITRFVSLGSILGIIALVSQATIFGLLGWLHFSGSYLTEALIITYLVGILGIALHHANIGRLIRGEERKFSFHPKTKA